MKYKTFKDFEAFATTVRDVNSNMMFRNPKDNVWSIGQLELSGSGIDLQLGRVSSGNIVEGQSRSDGYLFYLPLSNKIEYLGNGTAFGLNSIAMLEPGCDFCMATRVEHDWCTAFIPTQLVSRSDEDEGSEPLFGFEQKKLRIINPKQDLLKRFRGFMSEIDLASTKCSNFESTPAAISAREELMKIVSSLLYSIQPLKLNLEGRPRITREKIIGRCRHLLEQRKGEPVRVGELAAVAGVSERTLRTAFNEYFGLGPVGYLQLRQLHQVHHALRKANPKTTLVSDVRASQGVYQLSRFARRYRQLFGELPSQTLRSIY